MSWVQKMVSKYYSLNFTDVFQYSGLDARLGDTWLYLADV